MIIIDFFYGLSFGGLGLAAYLQLRRGGDFPLRKLLPWLAAFGFACGATGWVEMFQIGEMDPDVTQILQVVQMVLQPLSGLLLLVFGWGLFARLLPLPRAMILLPGILLVPFAYIITYAISTFVTPSPLEIPIDIWSRYLLYLPGSILAGAGFLRQWTYQRKLGYSDVANLMLGAGLAFLVEAFVMGLVVPAAPHAPASYYNYDRVVYNAFAGENIWSVSDHYGLTAWLDDRRVLEVTGLPIQFWRMISAFAVTFFVVRGLDVFEAIQRRLVQSLQNERDRAQQAAFEAQIAARQTAENWTDALVNISSRIAELEDVDNILLYIVECSRRMLNADFMGLALLNDEPPHLRLKCYALENQTELVDSPIAVDNPLILNTLGIKSLGLPDLNAPAHEPLDAYCSPENELLERLQGTCFFSDQAARSLAVVRLKLDTQTVGALWVARFSRRPFSETDLIWMTSLADQVVIAIKHGLFTSQLQSLSVTEERARIAREMHDGLAQVLGYLNLQVQTLDAFLQQGKLEKLQEKLGQMRQAIQVAHADVRENILSLRTTLANEKGVVQSIEEYLAEFEIQTKIQTHFNNLVTGELDLASLAEVQLACILQEALTNVRKHAQAENVSVILDKQGQDSDGRILLLVRDDGIGFTTTGQKRSFGLQTMTERAQSVGGSLQVWSAPNQGTQVECSIPCLRNERLRSSGRVLENGERAPVEAAGQSPDQEVDA